MIAITPGTARGVVMVYAAQALIPLGGYCGDESKADELLAKLNQTMPGEDFMTAAQWLKGRS